MPKYIGPGASSAYVYNFDPVRIPKIRRAIGRVRTGQASGSILCIGDSTVLGGGSTATGTGNLKTYSWPGQLAIGLNALGINAHANTVMGGGSDSPVNNRSHPYDPRVTVGSSWSYNVLSLGGSTMLSTTATNAFSFAPGVAVDTFRVWYIANGNLGNFTMQIGSGTATTVVTNGAAAFTSATIKGTLSASNVLNVKWVAGGSGNGVFVDGFEAWDSSKPWISVVNAGWVGSKTSDWLGTASPYDVLNAVVKYAADLVIVSLGPNDWNTGTTVATFKANLITIVTAAKAVSDVIIVATAPSNPANGYAATAAQALFISAMRDVAFLLNVPFVDQWTRMGGDFVTAQANGFMYDDVHSSGPGYYDQTRPLLSMIAAQ